ncbi:MAG: hypothetical protein JSR98_22235 [Proteobacteria bacterium]|nr:hypothetical protein [Pseudomonadota bacterium]
MVVALSALAGASVALCACETPGNNVAGTADYDGLKQARDACVARGGELVLKDQGDPEYLQDYVCKVK